MVETQFLLPTDTERNTQRQSQGDQRNEFPMFNTFKELIKLSVEKQAL